MERGAVVIVGKRAGRLGIKRNISDVNNDLILLYNTNRPTRFTASIRLCILTRSKVLRLALALSFSRRFRSSLLVIRRRIASLRASISIIVLLITTSSVTNPKTIGLGLESSAII